MRCFVQDLLAPTPPLPTMPLEPRTTSSAILHFPDDLAQSLLRILAPFLIGWCKSKLRQVLTLKDPMWKRLLKMSNSYSLAVHLKVAKVYSNNFKKNRIPRRTHTGSSATSSKGPELGGRTLGPRETGHLSPEVFKSQFVACVTILSTSTKADFKWPTWHHWIQSWEEIRSGTPL